MHRVTTFIIIALSASSLALGRVQPELPKGLTVVDWNQIQAEFERNFYRVSRDGGGISAENMQQQWTTRFDGKGYSIEPNGSDWRWGLELTGRNGAARIRTHSNKVTYQWSDTLEEWFINEPRGLEHGFTLRAPVAEIRLAVRGGLRAKAIAPGIQFVDQDGIARVNYTSLEAWDADGRRIPARMAAAVNYVVLTVDDRGGRYPITIDPVAQQAYLKASNNMISSLRPPFLFGRSVAVSGNTVVVGCPGGGDPIVPGGVDRTGAVYVFVRNGQTWTQQTYLMPKIYYRPNGFGASVAISGDTVVVGAPGDESNATGVNGNENDHSAFGTGAAYVFVRNGTTWTQQAYLKASNAGIEDLFGRSVGISGNTIVVGAHMEDSAASIVNGDQTSNGAPNSGAAYVFLRNGNSWTQQAYLKAANSQADTRFGWSVAISGDTVAVGAYTESSGIPARSYRSGAAYVFGRTGSIWTQQAFLKASNYADVNFFGWSIAVSGDTVVVGATGERSSSTGVNGNQNQPANYGQSAYYSGAAYVFVRRGTWTQQAYLKASTVDLYSPSLSPDQFGHSVGISGDTIVVGAAQENSKATGLNGDQSDNSAQGSGAAYVFTRNGVEWSQQAYVKSSNARMSHHFGYASAVDGTTVVVGADGETSDARGVNAETSARIGYGNSGAGYILDTASSATTVSVATSPAVDLDNFGGVGMGLSFTSAGDGCSAGRFDAPQSLTWTPGSPCVLTFASPQVMKNGGTRYVFNRWEDHSTNPSRTVVAPQSGANYSAFFDTQHRLYTTSSPGGTISAGGFHNAGTTVTITATPKPGYTFVNFTGATTSTSNPLTVVIDGPKSVTANFAPNPVPVTISSSPAGRSFAWSGTGCSPGSGTTPLTLSWIPGSYCVITFGATQDGAPGTQYVFTRWENNSASPARGVTVPSTSTTYTASFDTQYLLTTWSSVGGAVTIGSYFKAGSNATVTAIPASGFAFVNFTGSVTSASNPTTLLMDGPKTLTANFSSDRRQPH